MDTLQEERWIKDQELFGAAVEALEGTITTTGAVATLSINMTLGEGGPCSVVTQNALTGGFVGRTVNIRFSDEIVCASGSGTFRSTKRTVAMALTRQ